jgi:hypothetical protein
MMEIRQCTCHTAVGLILSHTLFNGKPKATASQNLCGSRNAVAFGLPLNEETMNRPCHY